ncbi:MAG: helix-turn-helix transcriptional regulator [Ruminococcus sp.]|nr:helix-turn-helix transcriptional regulator [Ruminococcus sp.]
MILADKIIRHRKKNGWSQEELAEKMGVSRQAVSKWEGAQSVPDLDKVLRLSSLFGVTTDYLLKDEIETEVFTETEAGTEPAVRRVSLEEAGAYLTLRKRAAVQIALGVLLCILSPVCLFILGGASENPSINISENAAGSIGLIVLVLFVAAAVGIFILTGFQNAPYEFLEKEPFDTEYGVTGMVGEKKKAYQGTYIRMNTIGIIFCVLSPIALFAGIFTENEFIAVVMMGVMMAIIGAGVFCLVLTGVRWASMQRLLKDPEYVDFDKDGKRTTKNVISTVYWMLALTIYLTWSFLSHDWHITWIVWAAAGVLCAPVMAVYSLLEKK